MPRFIVEPNNGLIKIVHAGSYDEAAQPAETGYGATEVTVYEFPLDGARYTIQPKRVTRADA